MITNARVFPLPLIAAVLVVALPNVIPLPSARLNVPAPLLVKIPWSAC